jgi:hypothetical protein
MLSLFCVLAVVAQPTVNANKDMTLIILNDVRICFIFASSLFWFDLVSTIIQIQGFLSTNSFLFHVRHSLVT